MDTTTNGRRGQKLRGSGTEWSRLRLAANLSLQELHLRTQDMGTPIPRSILGLIDQGRLMPSPEQARAILAVLSGPETI